MPLGAAVCNLRLLSWNEVHRITFPAPFILCYRCIWRFSLLKPFRCPHFRSLNSVFLCLPITNGSFLVSLHSSLIPHATFSFCFHSPLFYNLLPAVSGLVPNTPVWSIFDRSPAFIGHSIYQSTVSTCFFFFVLRYLQIVS